MKKIDDKINTLQAVHTRKPKITPNHITILHILLLIPLFFLLKSRLWIPSAISFLVTGILDLLDGYMARKWKMETALGKILDPLADKIGTVLVLIFLIIYTSQFRIIFIALIAIEAMFFILSLIMIASGKKLMIKKTNKISMFLMFIILDSYLFIHGLQDSSPVILFYILILISLSRIVTLLTTLIYYLKNQNF